MASKIIPLFCSLFLVACGGGGSAVAQPPGGNVPVYVTTYGDSTQRAENAAEASRILDGRAVVTAEGVDGSNSTQLLLGTDTRHLPWSQELARSNAQIVVVNHGINDRDETIYRANLNALVNGARVAGKIMMLETPNPMEQAKLDAKGSAFDVPAFERRRQIMRDVATSTGVYLCEQVPVDTVDGMHPTAVGYAAKGARLAQCLDDLI